MTSQQPLSTLSCFLVKLAKSISAHSFLLLPLIQEGQLSVTGKNACSKYLGGLSLPRKNVVR